MTEQVPCFYSWERKRCCSSCCPGLPSCQEQSWVNLQRELSPAGKGQCTQSPLRSAVGADPQPWWWTLVGPPMTTGFSWPLQIRTNLVPRTGLCLEMALAQQITALHQDKGYLLLTLSAASQFCHLTQKEGKKGFYTTHLQSVTSTCCISTFSTSPLSPPLCLMSSVYCRQPIIAILYNYVLSSI